MTKDLPSFLRREMYKGFPLESYSHSGFCFFSDRNEKNLSQELSIRENGKFVLWKNAFSGPLPDDNLIYVRMGWRSPLNPHFLSSIRLIVGLQVGEQIASSRVAPGVEFVPATPIFKSTLLTGEAMYRMPHSHGFIDMGYKRPYVSSFHLGRQLKDDEHYVINFFCSGHRIPVEWDFFCFGVHFAVSDALAESLKRNFESLEFDPILVHPDSGA